MPTLNANIRSLSTMANRLNTQIGRLAKQYKSQHGAGSTTMATRTRTATKKGRGGARRRAGSGNKRIAKNAANTVL